MTIRPKYRAGIVVGIDREPSEAEFRRQVIQLAKLHRWRVAGFRPGQNRRGRWSTAMDGDVGWPDLFLVKGSVALALELKVGKRCATSEQVLWLEALEDAGIEVAVCYPSDWPWIEAKLRGE